MLRRHATLTHMPKYLNKTAACRDELIANVCVLLQENMHSALQEAMNRQQYQKDMHGNIPDCHKWTEESIIVQKRPFETFTLASAFSHPGLGLANILDSKKC